MAVIFFAYETYFHLFTLIFHAWGCNLQNTILNGIKCNIVNKGKGSVFN